MQEEEFSPHQSLQLIQSMIEKAKTNISGNSLYFLIWGWLTFAACLGQFLLKHVLQYPRHYLVWWVIPLGVAASVWGGMRQHREKKVKTYIDESMKFLWIGMGISFFVLAMILGNIGWDKNVFPFYILLYGLGTFVSGCFLQFRPFVVGGILAWVLALVAVRVEYDYQILVASAALLFSYIIPGHLLKAFRQRAENTAGHV
jgi:hypothetical protein